MLDAKGAHQFDWKYLIKPKSILNNSNCFNIARLSKMDRIINHETVQLKIEEIYYGGLSSTNRRRPVRTLILDLIYLHFLAKENACLIFCF